MLQGRTFINTGTNTTENELSKALSKAGAYVLSMPLVEIIPLPITENMRQAILKGTFQWIVFTSKNGVNGLFNQLPLQTSGTPPFQTAVFGKRADATLRKKGLIPNLIHTGNTATDLLNDLLPLLRPSDKVLLALGNLAPDHLIHPIEKKANVERLNVYRTVFTPTLDSDILLKIKTGTYDLILFTSPSGVKSFLYHTQGKIERTSLKTAAIGSTTKKALQEEGIIPIVVAVPSGKEGLIKSLETHYQNPTKNP